MEPEEKDAFEIHAILAGIECGLSPIHAAIENGWTPKKLKLRMTDKDFAELIMAALDVADAKIESRLYEQADQGNMTAITTWLFNRMPHKWSDRKRIDVVTGNVINATVVIHTKEAVKELLLSESTEDFTRALSPGGALDSEVIDAEVIEDGD